MDVTFVLSAIIFTLLAVVVATSLLNGSSSGAAKTRSCSGDRGGDAAGEPGRPGPGPGPRQNGHVPEEKVKVKVVEDWSEISESSHDHWDVVKSVLSVSSLQSVRHAVYKPRVAVCFC